MATIARPRRNPLSLWWRGTVVASVDHAEVLEKVRGQSSYKDLTQTSNSLDVSVAGMVRGARVVATYPRGNTYATELELDTRNLYHLNQLMAGQF